MTTRPSKPENATGPVGARARPYRSHSGTGLRLPDKPVLVILLLVIFLRMSHLHVLLGDFGFQVTLAIELAIYLYYATISAKSFNYGAIAIIVLFVGFLLFEALNFTFIAGTSLNPNAIFQYTTILSLFVFYETKASTDFIQRVIIAIVAVYLLFYNLFYDQILAAIPTDSSLYRPASGGREARLNLAQGLATFGVIVGLFSLKRSPIQAAALVGLGIFAIFGAESRAFSAALALGLLSMGFSSLLPSLKHATNWALAIIFLVLSLVLLGPQFGLDYNPYVVFSSDPSGLARYLQYRDGLYTLDNRLLLGVGIPSSTEDLQYFVNPIRPFFPSDLGIFGISFLFGLPFTFAYIFLSVRLITRPAYNERHRRMLPLFYTVQLQAFLGFFSAGILNSTTAVFVALTIACWLKHSSAVAVAPPPRSTSNSQATSAKTAPKQSP